MHKISFLSTESFSIRRQQRCINKSSRIRHFSGDSYAFSTFTTRQVSLRTEDIVELKSKNKKKGKIPESSTKIQFPLANSHPDPVCVIYPKSLKKEFSNNYHTPRLPAHYKTHDQISLAKIPGRAGNSPEPSLFFIPATLSFRRSALARLNIARPARALFFRRRIGFHILYRRHSAFLPSAYFPLRNLCRARKERIMEFCFSRRHRRRCDKPPLVLFAGVSSEERKKEREVV